MTRIWGIYWSNLEITVDGKTWKKQTPTQFHSWMFYLLPILALPAFRSRLWHEPQHLHNDQMTRTRKDAKRCEKFQDANSIQLMSASYTINRHRITRDWKAVVTATILISFCQPGLLRSNVAPSPRTLELIGNQF